MFCKNCGNKLAEGQAFCTSCGMKQEPEIASSTTGAETSTVNNGGMDNNPSYNANMPNVNNMNGGNANNNQNQMGNNMNMNPNFNTNMNNNPSGNNNGTPGKNDTLKIIIIAIAIALVAAIIISTVYSLKNAKNNQDGKKETETKEKSEVGKVGNQKVYSGFKFTIPEGYTANISGAGELVLTNGDVTYSIAVDNSTYEANVQTIVTAQPKLKGNLEGTINNRKVAAMYIPKYQCMVLLSKASDSQTFFVLIKRESGKAEAKEIREIVDILNKAEKDESTFDEGIDSSNSIKDKISEDNGDTLESFKFE